MAFKKANVAVPSLWKNSAAGATEPSQTIL